MKLTETSQVKGDGRGKRLVTRNWVTPTLLPWCGPGWNPWTTACQHPMGGREDRGHEPRRGSVRRTLCMDHRPQAHPARTTFNTSQFVKGINSQERSTLPPPGCQWELTAAGENLVQSVLGTLEGRDWIRWSPMNMGEGVLSRGRDEHRRKIFFYPPPATKNMKIR